MSRTFSLLLLLGLLAPLPARAQHQWVPVLFPEESTISIDTASVTRSSPTRVSAWIEWSRADPVALVGLQVSGVREYREHDCTGRRFRSLGIFLVAPSGEMVDAARDPDQVWERSPDEGEDAELLRLVCRIGLGPLD